MQQSVYRVSNNKTSSLYDSRAVLDFLRVEAIELSIRALDLTTMTYERSLWWFNPEVDIRRYKNKRIFTQVGGSEIELSPVPVFDRYKNPRSPFRKTQLVYVFNSGRIAIWGNGELLSASPEEIDGSFKYRTYIFDADVWSRWETADFIRQYIVGRLSP